jgi:hypothetical protein
MSFSSAVAQYGKHRALTDVYWRWRFKLRGIMR